MNFSASAGEELSIALHFRIARTIPEAQIITPVIIETLLENKNPVATITKPIYEISNNTTTGMFAPPMGMTINIPRAEEITKKARRYIPQV